MANRKDQRQAARDNWKHVDGGYAFVIPYSLLRHENLRRASGHAVKLVLDLGTQYSGLNNGYLCAAWELMRQTGWKSRETLYFAIAEAEHYRLIQKTRQGGRNRPNLYALTWWPIHSKDDNPLDEAATTSPSNAWKESRPPFVRAIGIEIRPATKKELHARRAA